MNWIVINGEGEVAPSAGITEIEQTYILESAIPCDDAQVVFLYQVSNPLHLAIPAAKSENYTTAPQHYRSD